MIPIGNVAHLYAHSNSPISMIINRLWWQCSVTEKILIILSKNIQKLTFKYILRQRELSRHFQHQHCIAKAAQNWLQWICTLNCIFNAFLIYTKYPHILVSTSTYIYTQAFDFCIRVALYTVQFGPSRSSQHFCFSDNDTK